MKRTRAYLNLPSLLNGSNGNDDKRPRYDTFTENNRQLFQTAISSIQSKTSNIASTSDRGNSKAKVSSSDDVIYVDTVDAIVIVDNEETPSSAAAADNVVATTIDAATVTTDTAATSAVADDGEDDDNNDVSEDDGKIKLKDLYLAAVAEDIPLVRTFTFKLASKIIQHILESDVGNITISSYKDYIENRNKILNILEKVDTSIYNLYMINEQLINRFVYKIIKHFITD